mmetsp:Transcript_103184/g.291356  ORF Transcript_103184/g.291356 Transcript_103184/m.291356 type:complete len:537 (-) Transcript_103184:133-1743(-)
MAVQDSKADALLAAADCQRASSDRPRWLIRYTLAVATLAFAGRAVPLSFLPLVLKQRFSQPDSVIGIVMAIYPFSALVATPWAARLARGTERIVAVHSAAIMVIALAMMLTSIAESIQSLCGATVSVAWIALCRAAQGMGASLYLSSNICLITRKFPDKLAYVVALIEVAVGSGGQLGRLCGGFFFDLGGFSCPFVLVASLQLLVGLVGLLCFSPEDRTGRLRTIEGRIDDVAVKDVQPRHRTLPWSELLTPRLCVGATGAFMMYFLGNFGDATLLQYLVEHLAPVTVGALSVCMSTRGLSYLVSSYFIAQLVHGELVSFERLMSIGFAFAFAGQVLMAPQPFITQFEAHSEARPSMQLLWLTQIGSFVVAMIGSSMMFVPALPLMQNEVRRHGDVAVEQVAELFATMMTLGEMLGPICGGWLVERVGFVHGSLVLGLACLPLLTFSVITYDHAVVVARRGNTRPPNDGGVNCGPRCASAIAFAGEASFAWRRLLRSAPSSIFRRTPVGTRGRADKATSKLNVEAGTSPSQGLCVL